MPDTTQELLAVAVEITREAAALAYDLREQGVTGVTTKSTATDVVTAADKATERYVREWLEHHAASGLLEVDDPTAGPLVRRYRLPPAHVPVLANPDNVCYRAFSGVEIVRAGRWLPQLVEALQDRDGVVRVRAAAALTKIDGSGAKAVTVLVGALKDKEVEVRRGAIWALGEFGPGAREALPELIAAIRDADPENRPKQSILEKITGVLGAFSFGGF